ncbi:MAG: hypothetical protein CUN56_08000, partial [Phototrophicales bacterium]
PPPLHTSLVTTQFDDRNRILIVRYKKELTAESTQQVYGWMFSVIQQVGMLARGVIYDFSDVRKFSRQNMSVAQKTSLTMNAKVDLSAVPVAMVAKTIMQEQHLTIMLNATPDQERKKIVKSVEEGIQFINDFHRKRQVQTTG